MSLTRTNAAQMAAETCAILQQGHYDGPDGSIVTIGEAVERATNSTSEYPDGSALPDWSAEFEATGIEVINTTTTDAARKLHEDGLNPVALNFASARNPGGGFLSGARAQEESLCRGSGLYHCLQGRAYYEIHRSLRTTMYTSYALYSPAVPVIRDEAGDLLEQPWPLAFITAAAPNAGALRQHGQFDEAAVVAAFEARIRKVLTIGAGHGHEAIVLGAWGCGAFQNDPKVVAPLFERILREDFAGAFRKVVIAVLDGTRERKFIEPFEMAFGQQSL